MPRPPSGCRSSSKAFCLNAEALRKKQGTRDVLLGPREDVDKAQLSATYLNSEAGGGIEPSYRSFADSGLTTWLPRHC